MAVAATPGVLSLIPTTGSGYIGSFTGTFTHTGGATQHYLGYMLFLPTPNVVNYTATGSCLVEYNRISNGMRLIDNAGTGWLGGQSGIPLGTPGAVLTNNQCTVNVQNATAFVAGNTMSVNVPVTFQATLGPVLGTFLQALDVNGVWTGMTQFGNWVLPGAPQTRSGPAISRHYSDKHSGLECDIYDHGHPPERRGRAFASSLDDQRSHRRRIAVPGRLLPGKQHAEPDQRHRIGFGIADGSHTGYPGITGE